MDLQEPRHAHDGLVSCGLPGCGRLHEAAAGMSQLKTYRSSAPTVRYESSYKPNLSWQRRQGPFPRWLRVSALLFVIALIIAMVAPFT